MNNSAPRYKSGLAFLVILCLHWFCAGEAFSQQSLVISGEYSSTSVREILSDLSLKYDLKFAFDSHELEKIKGTWKFENASVQDVLNSLLAKSDFTFQMLDDVIVIYFNATSSESAVSDTLSTNEMVTLIGEVRDAYSGELLPFATLTFRSTQQSVTTDTDGRFYIGVRANLSDTIRVFFVGYESAIVDVKTGNQDKKLVIRLEPQRNYLPDVLIEAEGIKSIESSSEPGLYLLNPGQMTSTSGTGESDIMRAAQILPGISATRESSNGLFIRGSNNDQILLSLDGFNIYHQDHFFGAFSAINTNAVKAISVHKGITDARYGGRIGGIVEVVGKEGNLKEKKIQVDISPLSLGVVFEAPMDTAGKSSIFITARRAFTGILYTPTYKSLFNTTYNASIVSGNSAKAQAFGNQTPDYYFQDINAKISFRTNDKNTFNLSAFSSRDELFVEYADTTDRELDNPRDVLYEDESTKRNNGISGRWLHQFNSLWEASARIGLSNFYGEYFSSDSIRNLLFDIDSVRFGSERTILRDMDSRLECIRKLHSGKIIFGIQTNQINSYIKQNEQGAILADSTVSGNVFAGYFSVNTGGFGKLKINPGLRVSYFSRNENWYPEPRLSIEYALIPEMWDLKFAAGRVNQFIQRTRDQSLYQNTPDFWQLASSEDIPVLQSDQLMFGTVLHHSGFVLDVEGYARRNEGVVSSQWYFTGSALYQGTAEIYGIDVLIMKDYHRHHFTAGYSWMNAKADYPTASLYDIPMNYWINHEVKFNYELKLKSWSINAFWVYGTGAPYTPLLGTYVMDLPDGHSREFPVYGRFNSATLPDYHRLDLAATWRKDTRKLKLELAASIFNVYNRSNLKNIQYVVLNNYNDEGRLNIGSRSVGMLGILPSIMIRLKF
ncbi:MAG: carboxypeptidase-like regulatory domain-containing protein [Flavobacteriales bacterium]|nr:carboxypeptidase-like regulatory domain-containing protein [Flavobacteriales bacterium]